MPKSLQQEISDILEREYRVGTVRKWKDGSQHMKVAPGKWVEVPKGHDPKAGAPPGEDLKGAKVYPGIGIIPDKGPWVDHLEGLPADTLKANTNPDGSIKEGRKKLHAAILESMLGKAAPVPPGEVPSAVLMMGGPASGKSSMTESMGLHLDDFVVADADKVKEKLPEYRKAVAHRARDAAAMAHEESSTLVNQVRSKAIEQNKNLVVDGTGKSARSYLEALDKMQAKGYHTRLIMADMDAELAKPRSEARAEKTGRYVPMSFIDEAYPKIPASFLEVSEHVDEFDVYDTRKFPPRLLWSKKDGVEQIHDPEWHKKFLRRAGARQETLALRETMLTLEKVLQKGRKMEPEKPKKKQPKTTMDDIRKAIMKGFEEEEKLLASLPKKFPKGEGVRDVPYDLDD